MSNFEVKVKRIKDVKHHENADRLDVVQVDGYRCIVQRDSFLKDSLIVYIPEAAIVPEWLLRRLGLEGKLAGKKKNRLKAMKLRGILSQGLIVPVETRIKNPISSDNKKPTIYEYFITDPTGKELPVFEGTDVSAFWDIIKYEPKIPTCMNGEVFNAYGYTLAYDIENFKNFPDVLLEHEDVYITEKLHGTWSCFAYHPEIDVPVVTSKGLSEKGLAFKHNEANKNNLYLRAFNATIDEDGKTIVDHAKEYFYVDKAFYILGEIYGSGIQDAAFVYDAKKPKFRVFDVYYREPGHGEYLGYYDLVAFCESLNLEMVPVLYVGPFSRGKMLELTDGKTILGGKNIREGVVITPVEERRDPEIGRVILKSVSEKYLLRKNGTEYQ